MSIFADTSLNATGIEQELPLAIWEIIYICVSTSTRVFPTHTYVGKQRTERRRCVDDIICPNGIPKLESRALFKDGTVERLRQRRGHLFSDSEKTNRYGFNVTVHCSVNDRSISKSIFRI